MSYSLFVNLHSHEKKRLATCTMNWIESETLHVSVHYIYFKCFEMYVNSITMCQKNKINKNNHQKNSHSLCELMEFCLLSSELNQTNDMMKWICTGPVGKSKEELLDNIQLASCRILFAYMSHWGACVNKNLKYVGNNILNFWKFMSSWFVYLKVWKMKMLQELSHITLSLHYHILQHSIIKHETQADIRFCSFCLPILPLLAHRRLCMSGLFWHLWV